MAKYDYTALKGQYIRGKMSIRELGRQHGIPAERISSLHAQARKKDSQGRDWTDLREEYQSRSTTHFVEEASKLEAKRRLRKAEVLDEAIELVAEAIASARETIAATDEVLDDDGKVVGTERRHPVLLKEIPVIIDRIKPLFAEESYGSGEEESGLPSGNGDDPSAFLIAGGSGELGRALLAGFARGAGRGPGQLVGRGVEGHALPVLESPSPD